MSIETEAFRLRLQSFDCIVDLGFECRFELQPSIGNRNRQSAMTIENHHSQSQIANRKIGNRQSAIFNERGAPCA
jgi:hypothetical protein